MLGYREGGTPINPYPPPPYTPGSPLPPYPRKCGLAPYTPGVGPGPPPPPSRGPWAVAWDPGYRGWWGASPHFLGYGGLGILGYSQTITAQGRGLS